MSPPKNAEGRRARAASDLKLPDEGNDSSIVRDGADIVTPLRRYLAVPVKIHPPAGRRTRVWGVYVCPICQASHFARLNSEDDAKGVRRSGCGRLIWLVPEDATAEAVSA
ncbi:hypothetical protein ACFYOK_10760 [Microbispora bryophytorum]|uniref:hypothetical protein n=1 Tax=Microbispora bryophytorum TaxID=1460882 RepID=UPI00340FFE02